jgi:hypothetical protein
VFWLVFFVALSGIVAWGTGHKPDLVQTEEQKILFLCYWELNENMPVMQHVGIAKMLTEAGLFPPEGVEIIRFDKTPDNLGVTLFKASSAQLQAALSPSGGYHSTRFFQNDTNVVCISG